MSLGWFFSADERVRPRISSSYRRPDRRHFPSLPAHENGEPPAEAQPEAGSALQVRPVPRAVPQRDGSQQAPPKLPQDQQRDVRDRRPAHQPEATRHLPEAQQLGDLQLHTSTLVGARRHVRPAHHQRTESGQRGGDRCHHHAHAGTREDDPQDQHCERHSECQQTGESSK